MMNWFLWFLNYTVVKFHDFYQYLRSESLRFFIASGILIMI